MFITALFRVAKKHKKPKCPSPDEWLIKIWYSPMMEYYLAIKKEWRILMGVGFLSGKYLELDDHDGGTNLWIY